MRAGFHTEELAIRHMGQPCQRMPEIRVMGSKRPRDILWRQPLSHPPIIGDIGLIIKIDKFMMAHLAKHQNGHNGKNNADENLAPILEDPVFYHFPAFVFKSGFIASNTSFSDIT